MLQTLEFWLVRTLRSEISNQYVHTDMKKVHLLLFLKVMYYTVPEQNVKHMRETILHFTEQSISYTLQIEIRIHSLRSSDFMCMHVQRKSREQQKLKGCICKAFSNLMQNNCVTKCVKEIKQ